MPKHNISPSTRFFPHRERYEMFDGKMLARKSCRKIEDFCTRFCHHKNRCSSAWFVFVCISQTADNRPQRARLHQSDLSSTAALQSGLIPDPKHPNSFHHVICILFLRLKSSGTRFEYMQSCCCSSTGRTAAVVVVLLYTSPDILCYCRYLLMIYCATVDTADIEL